MPVSARTKVDEETTAIMQEAAKVCSEEAVRQVREHGLVLTVAEGNAIVEILPDGTRRILKDLPPAPPSLPKGMVLRYR